MTKTYARERSSLMLLGGHPVKPLGYPRPWREEGSSIALNKQDRAMDVGDLTIKKTVQITISY